MTVILECGVAIRTNNTSMKQNRESRNKSRYIWTTDFWQGAEIIQGRKFFFNSEATNAALDEEDEHKEERTSIHSSHLLQKIIQEFSKFEN